MENTIESKLSDILLSNNVIEDKKYLTMCSDGGVEVFSLKTKDEEISEYFLESFLKMNHIENGDFILVHFLDYGEEWDIKARKTIREFLKGISLKDDLKFMFGA